jgi:DNA invertase Pin-like site-specific DNA recombinase
MDTCGSDRNGKAGLEAVAGRKIGYARVSTGGQKLRLQLDALNDAGCTNIFRDEGVSGNQKNRPGLNKALQVLRRGDVFVVWKLDRLGRSLPHLIDVTSNLTQRGVGFKSLSESIDTTTAGGKLFFHIMGALAEFERSLISERTVAGMKAAVKRGVHVGRPRKLDAEQVRLAVQAIASGTAPEIITARYSVCPATLIRALKRQGEVAALSEIRKLNLKRA